MDLATHAQHDCNKIRGVQMIKDAKWKNENEIFPAPLQFRQKAASTARSITAKSSTTKCFFFFCVAPLCETAKWEEPGGGEKGALPAS